jgi:hypothetical protein
MASTSIVPSLSSTPSTPPDNQQPDKPPSNSSNLYLSVSHTNTVFNTHTLFQCYLSCNSFSPPLRLKRHRSEVLCNATPSASSYRRSPCTRHRPRPTYTGLETQTLRCKTKDVRRLDRGRWLQMERDHGQSRSHLITTIYSSNTFYLAAHGTTSPCQTPV